MVDKILAVVPDAGVLVTGTDEVVVRMPHVDESVAHALGCDRRQRCSLVSARRELTIEPVHRQFVVLSDPLHIGVGQVDVAIAVDLCAGCRIIHDTFASVGARHVIVWKS